MARRFALALALLGALLAPSSASADPALVKRWVPSLGEMPGVFYPQFSVSGPHLAGPAAVWARNLPTDGWVVERAAPGAAPVEVARSTRPASDHHLVGLIGASPGRVAWTDNAYYVLNAHDGSFMTVRSELWAATTEPGSQGRVAGCDNAGGPSCTCPSSCGDHAFVGELDGDVLAYVDGYRYGPGGTIVVDDLSSADEPVRIDPGESFDFGVQIAGDYVAWLARRPDPNSRLYVRNWRTGEPVYDVPASSLADLQPDGKAIGAASYDGRLRWYSPSDPSPHLIERRPGRYFLGLRMVADRVAFIDSAKYQRDRGIGVAGLDGEVTVVARGLHEPADYDGLDFDGRRLAWLSVQCGVASVLVEPDAVDSPGGAAPAPGCSPPGVNDMRVDSRGRLAVRLLCRLGCRGKLTGYAVTPPARRLASRRIDLPARTRPQGVLLTPSASDREKLSEAGAMRVQVLFSGRDGRGHQVGGGSAGKVRRP